MRNFILVFALLAFQVTVFGQTKPERFATVYVYSLATTTTLGQIRKPIFLDGKEIADIRPEKYFIVLIEPGKHVLHMKNKKFGGIEKDFEAGKIYYARIDWRNNGLAVVPQGFSIVPEENGVFDIKQLKPVDKKNIRNHDIVKLSLDSQ